MEVFIGTIQPFAFNFAPRGWALCNGQTMSIAQNTAMFSLLGTIYGGNGQTTFNLPDLQGRMPIGMGQGPGLPLHNIGEASGSPSTVLTSGQLPTHTHAVQVQVGGAASNPALAPSATNQFLGASIGGSPAAAAIWSDTLSSPVTMGGAQAGLAGNSQPVDIMNPYLALNFSIAILGIFPSRN
ncbi:MULTISPECIES: phage tail protein [Pseudomonadaceae]|jgi:microcystin-dependent protein|uniref:Tail protein n=1 Tax=Stutzerimonas stutzeri TaxID=316 RepID=A0A0D9AGW6_STUST|nr:tail fiber protein [Stutzerimonas stutzeri]KJH80208.1 tail protein [Stutzerimonas stutzeri]